MAYGYINQQALPYAFLKSQLWHAGLLQGRDHFDVLNQHLSRGLVRPGELVIVPEAPGAHCTIEEAWLMRHAEEISRRLNQDMPLDGTGNKNYDLAQSILGYGSIGIGSATSAWSRHLKEVAHTLEDIEQLHRRLKDGGLDRETFIRQRQQMFGVLDSQLQGAARFGSGLRGNQPLKGTLGISTKSYLHQGEIAGYAQRVRAITQMSQRLKQGTYLGMALDVGVAGLEIKEACVAGREAQCRRAKYVETGRLVGGVFGAAVVGKRAANIARSACRVALGVSLKGNGELACGVIGGAVGGAAGGSFLGELGGFLGGRILEVDGDLIFQPEGT
ncbi:hypothetical protein AYK59_22265 [Pseudomonas synxantha]|uniref:SSU ribosomal protein S2p (SAe) n=1 Tax=Pseudomonas libanensis TaxID=75588 RepID=A0ABR5M9G7_9PSED|nr:MULTISPECIES: hypothetical protein [Pseudomonas]AMS22723.1 hypothetical protein AYK59_22265 [Pseudomonas synxantha]KPG75575.1 hypothetical protein AEQ48_10300 [Pseudomonas libanensis]MDT3230638.1 hypothetical protein [Pseudomonas sp. rhizo25]WDG40606.1 hypothetical protein PUP72_18335 [Pseudomonas synxantha]